MKCASVGKQVPDWCIPVPREVRVGYWAAHLRTNDSQETRSSSDPGSKCEYFRKVTGGIRTGIRKMPSRGGQVVCFEGRLAHEISPSRPARGEFGGFPRGTPIPVRRQEPHDRPNRAIEYHVDHAFELEQRSRSRATPYGWTRCATRPAWPSSTTSARGNPSAWGTRCSPRHPARRHREAGVGLPHRRPPPRRRPAFAVLLGDDLIDPRKTCSPDARRPRPVRRQRGRPDGRTPGVDPTSTAARTSSRRGRTGRSALPASSRRRPLRTRRAATHAVIGRRYALAPRLRHRGAHPHRPGRRDQADRRPAGTRRRNSPRAARCTGSSSTDFATTPATRGTICARCPGRPAIVTTSGPNSAPGSRSA